MQNAERKMLNAKAACSCIVHSAFCIQAVALWSVVAVMAAASVAPVAAQFGGKATRPQVEPPKGPVRQVIFKNCTSCHGIDDYAYNALDRAGWNALIETKHKDLNVPISDKDRDLLLDWVVAKFGPDSRPFPRAYVPLRSRRSSATLKPRHFSTGRARHVMAWTA